MRRFLKKVELPAGLPYAILTAELAPQPDKKTGRVPTEQKMAKWQRVRPVMNEILLGKGTCRGRGGQGPGDRAQGAAGAGLAAEGRGLRGPASPSRADSRAVSAVPRHGGTTAPDTGHAPRHGPVIRADPDVRIPANPNGESRVSGRLASEAA